MGDCAGWVDGEKVELYDNIFLNPTISSNDGQDCEIFNFARKIKDIYYRV